MGVQLSDQPTSMEYRGLLGKLLAPELVCIS